MLSLDGSEGAARPSWQDVTVRKSVEVLTFVGCPNAEPAVDLVQRLALDLGVSAEVVRVDVKDADEAQSLRFLGSPSVRVDGQDIEPGAELRTDFAYSCRVYRHGSGWSGLPNEDWIRAALEVRQSTAMSVDESTRERSG